MQTFLRRLEILNYLRSQKRHVSTDDILRHLLDAGYLHSTDRLDRSQFRLVQRDLNFLLGEEFEAGDFDNEFGLSRVKGERKSQRWRLEPFQELSYDFERIPAFMALALSVTQKHLTQVLPSDTQQELQRIFSGAEEKLSKSEQKLSPLHYQRLSQSVEFFQRGQKLQAPKFDMAILDTIYRAILMGKRIQFSYSSRQQTRDYDLHPFGVVIMLPKIYLIGIKENDMPDYAPTDFRSFLVHKIQDISLSAFAHQVPDDFRLKAYLDAGNMDVALTQNDNHAYQLTLELTIDESSNLMSDLLESPISADQQIKALDEGKWLLCATVKRTVQLRNWLLALGPQAKVLSPEIIQQDLITYLTDIHQVYN